MSQPEPVVIPNQWYAILEARRLRRRPVGIVRLGRRLVLWRDGRGAAVCAPAACPHRGADLGLGRVVDGELECPYHGFRFANDGRCTLAPFEGKGKRLRSDLAAEPLVLREEHGLLWLFAGRPLAAELPPLPWLEERAGPWQAAATWTQEWPASFTRTVESMLDMFHFSVLHRRWTPALPLLDPYEASLAGNTIGQRGHLRRDDGRSAQEAPGLFFRADLHFPATLYFRVGKKERAGFVVVCCPIDDDRTWIYARYRQSYVRAPGLGRLLTWLTATADRWFIVRDDRRIAASSQPQRATAQSSKLVRGDAAIALWHKLRRRALDEREMGGDQSARTAAAAGSAG